MAEPGGNAEQALRALLDCQAQILEEQKKQTRWMMIWSMLTCLGLPIGAGVSAYLGYTDRDSREVEGQRFQRVITRSLGSWKGGTAESAAVWEYAERFCRRIR